MLTVGTAEFNGTFNCHCGLSQNKRFVLEHHGNVYLIRFRLHVMSLCHANTNFRMNLVFAYLSISLLQIPSISQLFQLTAMSDMKMNVLLMMRTCFLSPYK